MVMENRMKSISLKVPEDLYRDYKKACRAKGLFLRVPILMKINEIVKEHSKVVKKTGPK